MNSRGVARNITKEEVEEYHGPIHYVSHHPVLKPQSESTPCQIVFNSSAAYSGHILNDYWAKGPQLLNSLVGILLRFRECEIAITDDTKKMYHSVKITELDQHMHRFLWRDMNQKIGLDVYVMASVSFDDQPAGNIAISGTTKNS